MKLFCRDDDDDDYSLIFSFDSMLIKSKEKEK